MFSHYLIWAYGSQNSRVRVKNYLENELGLLIKILEEKQDYDLYLVDHSVYNSQSIKIANDCNSSFLIYEEIDKFSDRGSQFCVLCGSFSYKKDIPSCKIKRVKEDLQLYNYIKF